MENSLYNSLCNYAVQTITTAGGIVDIKEVKGSNRRVEAVVSRSMIANYMRDLGWSLLQIGKMMNLHHSTIINSIDNHKSDYNVNYRYKWTDVGYKTIYNTFSDMCQNLNIGFELIEKIDLNTDRLVELHTNIETLQKAMIQAQNAYKEAVKEFNYYISQVKLPSPKKVNKLQSIS